MEPILRFRNIRSIRFYEPVTTKLESTNSNTHERNFLLREFLDQHLLENRSYLSFLECPRPLRPLHGLGGFTYEKVGSVHLEGINASLGESDSGDETPLIKIPSGVPVEG